MRQGSYRSGLSIIVGLVTIACSVVGMARAACNLSLDAGVLSATIEAIFDPTVFAQCPDLDANHDLRMSAADLPGLAIALQTPQPTATTRATLTRTLTALPSRTPTPTLVPTDTPLPTGTPTLTATLTPSPTPPPTQTPTPTQSPTPPPTLTATPTPSSTPPPTGTPTSLNQAPVLPTLAVYRTFAGFPIAVPIGATDPDNQPLAYTATDDLPEGASLDSGSGILTWTPQADLDQLGPFYIPYSVTDTAVPPGMASGQLIFKVQGLDQCTVPTCDPATGCTSTLTGIGGGCCASGVAPRVAEPVADCPAGRVFYAGRNTNGFGRLHNCDRLRVLVSPQSGAAIRLNFEARCVKIASPVGIHETLRTTGGVILDHTQPVVLLARSDGYVRRLGLTIQIPGDGSGLEGTEADLTITLQDVDGVTITTKVRLILTLNGLSDLPDL